MIESMQDIISEMVDIMWDIEGECLSHTENSDGEWESMEINYDKWVNLLNRLGMIQKIADSLKDEKTK